MIDGDNVMLILTADLTHGTALQVVNVEEDIIPSE